MPRRTTGPRVTVRAAQTRLAQGLLALTDVHAAEVAGAVCVDLTALVSVAGRAGAAAVDVCLGAIGDAVHTRGELTRAAGADAAGAVVAELALRFRGGGRIFTAGGEGRQGQA